MGKYVEIEKVKAELQRLTGGDTGRRLSYKEMCEAIDSLKSDERVINADKLHYRKLYFLDKDGNSRSAVVVFAKEIDKMARADAAATDEAEFVKKHTNQTVCFFGPSPAQMCGYDNAAYGTLMTYLEKYAENLYQRGYRNFITCASQGFEQLMFWAINRISKNHPDVKNVVMLPYKEVDAKWSRAGAFSKDDFSKIMSIATEVICETDEMPDKKNVQQWYRLESCRTAADASDLVAFMLPEGGVEEGKIKYMIEYCTSTGCMIDRLRYKIENGTIHISSAKLAKPE